MLWSADDLVMATAGRMTTPFSAGGVAIDSRTLVPGDLFIALRARRDGHDFVAGALQRGAAGAMVSRIPPALPHDAPLLVVEDTEAGLRALGAYARARFSGRVVALTGSVGKTSTKEMLQCVLSRAGPVHAAAASHNNHLGVPLTLARTPAEAEFLVVEIGMNHAGEIAPLARLARPHVGLITAIAPAHIGPLGSLEAIAREKASLFSALAPHGVAVFPAEAPHAGLLREAAAAHRVVTFGAAEGDVRLLDSRLAAEGSENEALVFGERIHFRLQVPGRHMVMNALGVLAVATLLGIDPEEAAAALAGFGALAGRGARRRLPWRGGEILLIDESYNASPAAVAAALETLALAGGRRIAVLGDMLELGAHGPAEHRALAPLAAAVADLVFAAGPLMRELFNAIPPARRGAWAPDAAALAPAVTAALQPGDVVLVKGSYGMGMKQIVDCLSGGEGRT